MLWEGRAGFTGHESSSRFMVQELFRGNKVDSMEQKTQYPPLASTHVHMYTFVQIPHPTATQNRMKRQKT